MTFLRRSLKQARKGIVAVIGFLLLLVGAAMIILPGPAFIVIPAGLMVLGTEFVWARDLLTAVRKKLRIRGY
jgi:hypothetical protein